MNDIEIDKCLTGHRARARSCERRRAPPAGCRDARLLSAPRSAQKVHMIMNLNRTGAARIDAHAQCDARDGGGAAVRGEARRRLAKRARPTCRRQTYPSSVVRADTAVIAVLDASHATEASDIAGNYAASRRGRTHARGQWHRAKNARKQKQKKAKSRATSQRQEEAYVGDVDRLGGVVERERDKAKVNGGTRRGGQSQQHERRQHLRFGPLRKKPTI